MEYFIGAVSVISLVINTLMYRRIIATYPVGTVEEFDLAPVQQYADPVCQCIGCKVEERTEPEQVEVHDPPPAMAQGVYSAWKNQTEIPWVPPTKTPEPIVKTPDREPLARPDGFV